MNKFYLSVLCILLGANILYSQSTPSGTANKKQAIQLRLGFNYSDFNYGYEFIGPVLNQNNYQFFQAGGNAAMGFEFGFSYLRPLNSRFQIGGGLYYTNFTYKIEGEVSDPINPPAPDDPNALNGLVNYNYLTLEAKLNYLLGTKDNNRFFLQPALKGHLFLNNKRISDVSFPDTPVKEIIRDNDDDTDYNAFLPSIALGAGYHLPINSKVSITPIVQFEYMLTPVTAGELNPMAFHFGLDINLWFDSLGKDTIDQQPN